MNLSHDTHSDATAATAPDADDVGTLLAVMEMLQSVIAEENAFLRTGLPASLFEWKEYKRDLADQYALLWRHYAEDLADGQRPAPDMLEVLFANAHALRDLTAENLGLLDGAIAATRRRIEAVITAAHAREVGASRYGATGESRLSTVSPRMARMSA